MASITSEDMRQYLSSSISSLNKNKLNGMLAEIEFRNYLASIGYSDRVSAGGWIARSDGSGTFGHETVVFFPEDVSPDREYTTDDSLPNPSAGLHTICSTFHQIGISSFYCAPRVLPGSSVTIDWHWMQLGLPTQQKYRHFPFALKGFAERSRRYNFLRYKTDVAAIPNEQVPEEFSKEHLRVSFQSRYMCELSDVDGILWGEQHTYPIEIKEKTPAQDRRLGDYFGLDVGPFVKLAFYAAKRGNLHSLFVVREIDNVDTRNLVAWWFITYDTLAQYASWVSRAGGTNMLGGGSTVVRIPKSEFTPLTASTVEAL